MSLIEIICLAIALAIDCFIVSFSQGLIFKKCRVKNSLKLATTMGLFQGVMPIFGYIATDYMYKFVVPFSKQIVFLIFFILGAKFILEAFQPKEKPVECIGFKCLIGLGIATSLDALVSGATLSLTRSGIIIPVLLIGLASFIMSLMGFWLGNYIKHIPSKYLEILGGLTLIVLAIKSLI